MKSVPYMDNVTFYCSSVRDAKRAELQLNICGSMSGLNVNLQKSQICIVSGTCETAGINIKQTDSLVILGTHFERDLSNQVNEAKIVEKVSNMADMIFLI